MKKNQRLLGPWPPSPYEESGYWQRINAERAEREDIDNTHVDWEEIREKYLEPIDEDVL